MITKVDERPINTLQYMIDNSKIPFTVYENGDQCISDLPGEYLNENGSVKVENGLMLWDEEELEVYREGAQEVADCLWGCLIFDTDMNCSKGQLKQVCEWLRKEFNINTENYIE